MKTPTKFIEVYDNLLPPPLEDFLLDFLLSNHSSMPTEVFANKSLTFGDQNSDFLDIGFSNGFLHPGDDSKPITGALLQPTYYLAFIKKILIHNMIIGRTFFQFPTKTPYTQEIHTDNTNPHWVCLYYANDSDGDTVFYNDDDEEIKRVSPKKGRIAFFDGSIKHAGSKPTKNKRIVINTNFLGEFYN